MPLFGKISVFLTEDETTNSKSVNVIAPEIYL
jgi:hypothetical protein